MKNEVRSKKERNHRVTKWMIELDPHGDNFLLSSYVGRSANSADIQYPSSFKPILDQQSLVILLVGDVVSPTHDGREHRAIIANIGTLVSARVRSTLISKRLWSCDDQRVDTNRSTASEKSGAPVFFQTHHWLSIPSASFC